MVELRVKLRCEEQERLGPVPHSNTSPSLRGQQRPLPLRPRCRRTPHRASLATRHHRLTRVVGPVAVVEAMSPAHTAPGGPPRTPADDCHLPSRCHSAPQVTTPSARPTGASLGNGKTRGATAPRVATGARLMRQSRRSKMRRREYRRLRNLLPALQEKQEVSKVEVVAEAARYIDDLHARLLHRLKTRGLPQQLKDLPIGVDEVHLGNIQDMVRHIMTVTNPASLPPAKIENTRMVPSFITAKTTKHKRP